VDQIVAVLLKNAEHACNVVREAVTAMPTTRACKCGSALKHAIITQKNVVPAATLQRLQLLVGKYFNSEEKAGT
jgi:5'-methylthioadenosine phosphorylase